MLKQARQSKPQAKEGRNLRKTPSLFSSRKLEHFQQPPLVKRVTLHAGPLKSLTQMKDDCQVQPLMFFVNHAHSLVFQTSRRNHCFHLDTARSAINLDLYLSLSIIPGVLRIFWHPWFITPSQSLIRYYKLFSIINEHYKHIAQSLLDGMAFCTKW